MPGFPYRKRGQGSSEFRVLFSAPCLVSPIERGDKGVPSLVSSSVSHAWFPWIEGGDRGRSILGASSISHSWFPLIGMKATRGNGTSQFIWDQRTGKGPVWAILLCPMPGFPLIERIPPSPPVLASIHGDPHLGHGCTLFVTTTPAINQSRTPMVVSHKPGQQTGSLIKACWHLRLGQFQFHMVQHNVWISLRSANDRERFSCQAG